ncbi:dienelactone hydrolase family protein [Alloalcanivorax marinus]|uniref:dienelactone hydrolase family protein n=1 Tax=Alloalcanivorax marinus TaxID=1177169 RepID=UPI001931732B|nr:dienelactone hydrolase family protein [Alloalcanivorax marinus]MBL7252232.1 dienelactone hydrolase family protein [Alloalcanivorax marinus]
MGEFIDVTAKDGGRFRAYLALPPAGKGPGLVVGQEIFGVNETMRRVADGYAEEGYVVLVPDLFWRIEPGIELGYEEADFQRAFELFQTVDLDRAIDDIDASLETLAARPEVTGGDLGFVGFCLGGKLAYLTAARTRVAVSVGYYGVGIEEHLDEAAQIQGRLVLHFAEQDGFCDETTRNQIITALGGTVSKLETFVYPGVDHAFARPGGDHFHKTSADMAHERTIAALKREIGPDVDLSALWDEHCRHEFATRNVDATMATMVAEPYVNHIPTMTGGVGYQQLSRFYRNHFVHGNPDDMTLVPVSRTVGATQLVDEFILSFTHDREIDWMLPGVAPTGKKVEIPMLGVIRFRGDKLCHEHIYWDQASVLKQIGLLDGEGLPVAGAETAHKLLDESLPSNTLMARWKDSEGK